MREQIVLCRTDARRRSSGRISQGLDRLDNIIRESGDIADEVRKNFTGLVESIWIEEYLNTRLMPFHEEMAAMNAEVLLWTKHI